MVTNNIRNEKGQFLKGHNSYPRVRKDRDNDLIIELYNKVKSANKTAEIMGCNYYPELFKLEKKLKK